MIPFKGKNIYFLIEKSNKTETKKRPAYCQAFFSISSSSSRMQLGKLPSLTP